MEYFLTKHMHEKKTLNRNYLEILSYQDLKEEIDLHIQDLKDTIPGFIEHGEVLHVGCYWGDWPTTRNSPYVGYTPLPQKSPVENLYDVGDGVGPRGWPSGTSGCAVTARIVVENIEKRIEPGT